jgi:hypothetical protein
MSFHRSRAVAALSLAIFVATFGLPLVSQSHALGDDVDAGWGERGIVVCHPETAVETPKRAADDEHCAICHWLRAFGASTVGARVRPQAPLLVRQATARHATSRQSSDRIPGPPRGPPASSL